MPSCYLSFSISALKCSDTYQGYRHQPDRPVQGIMPL